MPNLDERFRIIDEMFAVYMNNVPERRVKLYLRRLPPEKIDTDRLRTAVAGCIDNGNQRGVPTVAEILRRAVEVGVRRSAFAEPEEVQPTIRECKKLVHQTRFGKLLCCREEGHALECEVRFGPQRWDGDAAVIRRLCAAEGEKVKTENLFEDIPF
jgi:hypothetical protein